MLDWDDGEYEHTAATLTPAAALACERLGLEPGLDVLPGTFLTTSRYELVALEKR